MTPDEVESYIGTLEASYTYDPPERWRGAYDRLLALRSRFRAAHKRYGWLSLIALPVLLLATMATLAKSITMIGWIDYLWFALLISIPSVFNGLAALLARRHEPLMRYEHQIDSACGKFDKVIAESTNAPA